MFMAARGEMSTFVYLDFLCVRVSLDPADHLIFSFALPRELQEHHKTYSTHTSCKEIINEFFKMNIEADKSSFSTAI